MVSKALLIGAILALGAITACGDGISITFDEFSGDDVRGSGTITTEDREVGNFDEIKLTGEGTVVVTEGPDPSLKITTDDNLLSHIETNVSGGVLEIATERGYDIDPTDSVVYDVTTPNLEAFTLTGAGDFEMAAVDADTFSIMLTGAGDVRIDQLTANDLDVTLTGAGSVTIGGEVTTQTINLPGAGSYHGSELKSSDANVTTSGVGSASVWATDRLNATVSGVGSIDYYGSPRLTTSVTGIGSINSRGEA